MLRTSSAYGGRNNVGVLVMIKSSPDQEDCIMMKILNPVSRPPLPMTGWGLGPRDKIGNLLYIHAHPQAIVTCAVASG